MSRARLPKNNVLSDGVEIINAATAGWVESETGSATVDLDRDFTYGDQPTYRFQAPAAAGSNAYINAPVNMDLSAARTISIAFWVSEIAVAVGSTFTVYFIESTPGTSLLQQATFTGAKPGWNIITRPISVFSGSGSWATIRQIRVRIDSSASVERDMYFAGLWYNKRNRPTLCFSFDDGWDDALVVDGYATTYKLPVSYGIIPSLIDDVAGNYLTTAELATLAASPCAQLCCHDNPRWADEVFLGEGETALLSRLHSIQRYIAALDPIGAQIGIYPEGDYGQTVAGLWKTFLPAFRRAGFRAARLVVPTTGEIPFIMDQQVGPGDPLLIPAAMSLNNGSTLTQAKALIDTTIRYGANCFIYGHQLAGSAGAIAWVESDFDALAAYAAARMRAGEIDVLFLSEWVGRIEGRRIAR